MPRQPRPQSTYGIYHVMFRGNNQQIIFEDDSDRRKFLSLLHQMQSENQKQNSCLIYAYCLMSNHVHILYRELDDSVQRSMKRLATAYALYFNVKYGRVGHLFQDRYRSEPCNCMDYFITLIRYIHQNPLKANIVSSVQDYKWSSWHEFIDDKINEEDKICNTEATLKHFSINELIDLVNKPLPEDSQCMDIDSNAILRMTDDTAESIFRNLYPDTNLPSLKCRDRRSIVRTLRNRHISCAQIARITGLSYRQTHRLLEKVK